MLQLLETGRVLYLLAAVCLFGIAAKLTVRNLYKRLVKETDNLALTKNRRLRELKQKVENTYRMNQGIRDTRSYLEKQLYEMRFRGLTLSGWGNLSSQMTLLCFLAGGAGAFFSYWYRLDSYYIVLYGASGLLFGLLSMVVDSGVNTTERRQQLLASLQDYVENTLFTRLSRSLPEEEGAEGEKESARSGPREISRLGERTAQNKRAARPVKREGGRVAKAQIKSQPQVQDQGGSRRDVDYLKRSLEQIAASRERTKSDENWLKDLNPEEIQLISDILREYLV